MGHVPTCMEESPNCQSVSGDLSMIFPASSHGAMLLLDTLGRPCHILQQRDRLYECFIAGSLMCIAISCFLCRQ